MRFLITGASGFIGSRLTEALERQHGKSNLQLLVPPHPKHSKEAARHEKLKSSGYDVVSVDLLHLPDDLADSLKPFDVLLHLAAFGETESKDLHMNAVNDRGTQELIRHLAKRLPGRRLIYVSTLAVVDRSFADNTPMDENYPCRPRTAYGVTKLNAEAIVRAEAAHIGFEWAIFRLPTVIGPGYRPGGLAEAIEKDLSANGLFTRLAWPGRIELVFVEDVVRVLIHAADMPMPADPLFHLTSGIAPTLDEMIARTALVIGVRRKRIALPGFFWKLVNTIIWCGPLRRVLPHDLKVMFWRLSLITSDGFVGASIHFSKVFPHRFVDLGAMLEATYGLMSRGLDRDQ